VHARTCTHTHTHTHTHTNKQKILSNPVVGHYLCNVLYCCVFYIHTCFFHSVLVSLCFNFYQLFWVDIIHQILLIPWQIYHKKETEEERELRLAKQRSYYFKRRVNETAAEREDRLKKIRENAKKRRLKETEEERAVRLKEKRVYETQRLGSESAEKRALRLEKQRLYQAQRVKHETSEERAERLKNKRSSYQRRRLNKKGSQMNSDELVDQSKCSQISQRSLKRNEILRDWNTV